MNAIELLKEYLEREYHNVFCYSKTYTMDSPKKGYEKEVYEAKEKVDILEKLISDLEGK